MSNYILWLASWYPGKTDPFNGDFVERHAKAVVAFTPVVVLFVTKDLSLKKGEVVIEKEVNEHLTVYRGYYGPSRFSLFEKLSSSSKYFFLQKKIFSQIKKERGLPSLVHVHVAFKAGVFARYLKSFYRLPYIITEHWTGYYPKSPNTIYRAGYFSLQGTKKVLKGASLLLPVARKLGETISQLTPVHFEVIPNVVDTNLFFYKPAAPSKPRFIHPSTMSYVKNPDGILKAAIELNREGYEFELLMIGGVTDSLVKLAEQAGALDRFVFFKNEIPYYRVASEMQNASALVLFSRFENLPCVILEAMCCGLPVVSTNVGGIAEVVNPANGILLDSENENALKESLKKMIDNYPHFNREHIALEASTMFSYSTVGKQIAEVYKRVLSKEINPW